MDVQVSVNPEGARHALHSVTRDGAFVLRRAIFLWDVAESRFRALRVEGGNMETYIVEQTVQGRNRRVLEVCKDKKFHGRYYRVLSGNGDVLGIYCKLDSALDHLRSRI